MKSITVPLLFLLCLRGTAWAQTERSDGGSDPFGRVEFLAQGSSADPAFASYREGYSLILSEQWNQAREKFRDLLARYPKSEYADDAGYWSAYALMHTSKQKARDAYERFIEQYPHSSYYDDAVADLAQIQAAAPEATPAGEILRPTAAPNAALLEWELQRVSRNLRRLHGFAAGSVLTVNGDDRPVDEDTRLRIEALYALGENREDERAFQTLKGIALDGRQARPLREAAIDGLAGFTRYDALTVFADIARQDTTTELQALAIDMISQGKDRQKSVALLIDLFAALPQERKPPLESVMYSIAGVGNDRAVDFLRTVALTHRDYSLRRDAVYYLGSIGGDRARAALYEILKGK